MKDALANRCLPYPLDDSMANVPCVILETLAPASGLTQANACDASKGLAQPDPAVLAKFVEGQNALNGDAGSPVGPVCELAQLTMKDFVNGSCADSPKPGWCYLAGAAAGGVCAQAIKFSATGSPKTDVKVILQCPVWLG